MTQRDDSAYLAYISEAINLVESYLQGMDESAFRSDTMTQDAVIRRLQVIGEAVKDLSDELQAQSPDIPWSQIARMRDKLVHQYFGVDLEVVWDAATRDLPELKQKLQRLL